MAIKIYKPRHRATVTGHRTLDLERDKRQKLYRGSDEWRNFCKRFLELNSECYCCGRNSNVVDHLIPAKGDKELFEKTGNHVGLCHICHNTVTGKFDAKYKTGSSIEDKTSWMNLERTRNELFQNRKFPSVKVLGYKP